MPTPPSAGRLPPLPTVESPVTEEELARVIVDGPPPKLTEPIEVRDYDPAWPDLFAAQADRIRAALGARALIIEHIGSTSVPGLAAKPIIDIDLIVEDSTDEDGYVPGLTEAGYTLHVREPDWYEHRLLKGHHPTVNLHVFSPDCDEHARHVIMRDWLRTHPEDRERYAARKRVVAQMPMTYTAEYANAKGDVIIDILKRAGLS